MPIIPDYLFSNDINDTTFNEKNKTYSGPTSLSPLQRKFETLENDNGPLGALLASKAFVQLAFTPIVGYLTSVIGCNIPLLLGSCNMLLAAIRKYSIKNIVNKITNINYFLSKFLLMVIHIACLY